MAETPNDPSDVPKQKSEMEEMLGLLRIRIKRGINLAVRDVRTSDPYVVVKMGKQVFPSSSSLHLIASFFFKFSRLEIVYSFAFFARLRCSFLNWKENNVSPPMMSSC